MKHFVYLQFFLVLTLVVLMVVGTTWAQSTIEVSGHTGITNNSSWDRNPSVTFYNGEYWLFYTKADNDGVRGVSGYNPDNELYIVWYKHAASIPELATATETKLSLSETARPVGFDQRLASAVAFNGSLYAFVSCGYSQAIHPVYFYKWDGSSWTGPTTLATAGAAHVNAVADANRVYLAVNSNPDNVDVYTWDGTTVNGPYNAGSANIVPKITLKGGTLYVISIAEPSWTSVEVWSGSASATPSFSYLSTPYTATGSAMVWDPTIFNDNTNLYVVVAPQIGDAPQWLAQTYSTDNGSTWSPSKNLSYGGYGSTYWWDFWPNGYFDGTDKYLFFGTEGNGTTYGDAEIAYLKMDWNLSNDHYLFIQNGIDKANSGDVINVAAGTYTGNINVNKSLTIVGDPGDASPGPGTNAPVVDGGGANIDAFKFSNGVTNVTIKGFVIQNFSSPGYNTVGSGIQAWVGSTSNITIQDNSFLNLGYNGILVGNDYNSDPSKWGNHTYWTVKKNIVSNCGYIGFELTNTSNSSIEDNIIHLATPYIGAIFSSARRSETGLTIKNNLIDGAPSTLYPVIYIYAYDLDMPNPNLNNVLIEDNTIATVGTPFQIYIRNIGTGTITGVQAHYNSISTFKNLTSAQIDASSNWWGSTDPIVVNGKISGTVDLTPILNSGTDTDPGTMGFQPDLSILTVHTLGSQAGTTGRIQEGINLVTGSTVNVAAGTYNEALTVNKANLTIQGAGPTLTFITTTTTTPGITVSTDGATIKNLGITNATQLVEGLRVSGATSGLTLDYVNFTNLGNNPGPGNAYGINILNSFSNLTVKNCEFVATNLGVYSRAIGIFAGNNFLLNNFQVDSSLFSYLFVGIYLRSDIDVLTATNNTFGPWELADCQAAAAGIYIGDGSLPNFDIKNITVTGNTFTSYARGIYMWNYAVGESFQKVDIINNTFTNSIYSSPIRLIARLASYPTAAEATIEGPITIDNNIFTQNTQIVGGSGVSMIDLRAGVESATSQIDINDNQITFNGPFTTSTWGILFRGPITNAEISGNTMNGNNSGGSSANMPATSGIVIQSNHSSFGPMSSNADISILSNDIQGFVDGVAVYNFVTNQYGGIPVGASININNNSITGNTTGVYSGAGEIIDATYNDWGSVHGPLDAIGTVEMPGNPSTPVADMKNTLPADKLGNAVSENVAYYKWQGKNNPNASGGGIWAGGYVNPTSNDIFAGFDPTALDGVDPLDIVAPPPPPNDYLYLYFLLAPGQPLENYSDDIKKEEASTATAAKHWNLKALTDHTSELVTIEFPTAGLPSGFKPTLYDLATGNYQDLRNSPFYTYTSPGTITPSSFLILIGDSTKPAVTVTTPNGGEFLVVGQPYNITWTSSDGTGVLRHYIYYSLTGVAPYTLIDSTNGNVYSFNWTPGAVSSGASIKVVARDSVMNEESDISNHTFQILATNSIAYNAVAGWNLVSPAIQQVDMTPTGIFGDDYSVPYYTFQYNPSGGYSVPSTLNMGQGYWLGSNNAQIIDAVGTPLSTANRALVSGFNIIGNPFAVSMLKDSLKFTDGIIIKNMVQAATSGWLSNVLYGYSGVSYFVEGMTLGVWSGYWIPMLVDGITVQYTPAVGVPTPKTIPIVVDATPTNWSVDLAASFTVNGTQFEDRIASFGVRSDATIGFDPLYDAPRPPKSPAQEYVEIIFPVSGESYPKLLGNAYARDYKVSDKAEWEFIVNISKEGTITLSWDNSVISKLSQEVKMNLYDVVSRKVIDMKKVNTYTFEQRGTSRKFMVNKVDKIIPTAYELIQNYPNPFNPTTTINYGLPFNAKVNVTVYDFLGRKVNTLIEGNQEAGYHDVIFDASQLASGMYFYRLTAITENGIRFIETRKMILTK